jgi:hypothetical protein
VLRLFGDDASLLDDVTAFAYEAFVDRQFFVAGRVGFHRVVLTLYSRV